MDDTPATIASTRTTKQLKTAVYKELDVSVNKREMVVSLTGTRLMGNRIFCWNVEEIII